VAEPMGKGMGPRPAFLQTCMR